MARLEKWKHENQVVRFDIEECAMCNECAIALARAHARQYLFRHAIVARAKLHTTC